MPAVSFKRRADSRVRTYRVRSVALFWNLPVAVELLPPAVSAYVLLGIDRKSQRIGEKFVKVGKSLS